MYLLSCNYLSRSNLINKYHFKEKDHTKKTNKKKIDKAKMNYKHNVLSRKRIPTTSRNSYKPDLV